MKLRQIEVFHALMSAGSVTGAARLLNISQPAVSKTLQHTELQLGFTLFERNRGQLKPTDEALLLYAEIVKIHPQIESIQRLSENLRRGTNRRIRILTIPTLAQTLMPRAIAEFLPEYEDCEIELSAGHSRDIVAALLLREADIAFDFGVVQHPAVHRTTILETEIVCVATQGWFPEKTPIAMEQLTIYPLIQLAKGDPLVESVLQQTAATDKPMRSIVSANTYHAVLALASAGAGAALLDPFTASSRNRAVVHMHRLAVSAPLSLCWFTSPNHPPNVMVRHLVAKVADVAKEILEKSADR